MTAHSKRSPAAARFNAAAQGYHSRASIQMKSARELLTLIPETCRPESILDLGCGTGILTELLSMRYPAASLTAVDTADAMLRVAAQRLGSSSGIRWHVGDIQSLPDETRWDLVASNAALHWMRPLVQTFEGIARRLKPGGCLLAGMMLDGTLGELHRARQRVVPELPVTAGLPTREEVLHALKLAGFEVDHVEVRLSQDKHDDAMQMMREIHSQGLTGGTLSHGRRLLTRGELRATALEYDREYKGPDGVPATYVIGFLRAHVA